MNLKQSLVERGSLAVRRYQHEPNISDKNASSGGVKLRGNYITQADIELIRVFYEG